MINFLILLITLAQITTPANTQNPDTSSATSKDGSNTTADSTSVNPNYIHYDSVFTNAGWTKVFDDDFNKDLSKWNIWTGGAYNHELQYYRKNNLVLKNGILHIIAKKEKVTGVTRPDIPDLSLFDYTSGRIESKASFSANSKTPRIRIAARMKLASGYGMWPAFWSYGTPWPAQGEIDFVELRGHEPYHYSTNYFYTQENGAIEISDAVGFITTDKDLTTGYHVFEMEWAENTLTSYLDGKVVETKTGGGYIPQLFGKKQHLVLNLAVGGGFFPDLKEQLIQPKTFCIDWVKVFAGK